MIVLFARISYANFSTFVAMIGRAIAVKIEHWPVLMHEKFGLLQGLKTKKAELARLSYING